MYTKILVPCDGSDHAFDALEVAAALIDKEEGTIFLAHVVPGAVMSEGLEEWARAEHVKEGTTWLYDQSIGQGVLDAARARVMGKGCKHVEDMICHGDPADEIVECARATGVDATVMGTRGLTRLKRLIIGSVAQKVLHHAPGTVVLVH